MPSREAAINPQPSPSEITVFAPAKINMILRILERRPDGFHNLWSIMQTVALEDEVQIRLRAGRQDIQLRCDATQLAADHSNLVYRAAAEVLARAQQSIGLDIELRKRIPMGAGLGGGSSDAAATIIGLNRLLQLEWSPTQMADAGQLIGSDVPFFLFAPSAFVAGRGETVRPVVVEGVRWVVLVNPGFGVNTKWAYQELAATRTAVTPLSLVQGELDRQSRVSWAQLIAAAENDFEAPVFDAYGKLREIKRSLQAHGAEIALLSGSGATVFGVFEDEARAQLAHAQFASENLMNVFVVPTCSGPLGWRYELPR
ncbi:MAG TPA: 4-(cytidine 5'-diphospho)-2-C-methyl-D-erythritol kinase [Nitrospiraceae bacterium]|nr:4-(cytidine 5'-diphospho)-2-C-methyl-D-erythritol kinase [Nitrospiraceae bacterium]